MNAVIREVTSQPLNPFKVRSEPMLHDQITAKTQNVSGIKQWFFFRSHKELFFSPFQTLRVTNFIA